MRILLLSDWMYNRGGAETYVMSLRDALRDQGDDVRLLTCGARSGDPAAGDVHAFGSDDCVVQTFLQLVNPFAVARVTEAVKSFRPDVALVSQFAYHLSPAVLRALRSVPTVVTMMDYKAICPVGTRLLPDGSICNVRAGAVCRTNGCVSVMHWVRDQPRYALIRSGLRSARRVLCTSRWMQKELAASGIDAAILLLGVRKPATSWRREPADVPTFAYCGRLSREKGVALLIAAFAKLRRDVPAARLRIFGDGPLRLELERLAIVLGVAELVEFRGWLASEKLDDELFDAWAVVAPSLWAEPFGLTAVEAVIRGIPVIASDSGGFLDTVENGVSGLFFPIGNVALLAERMRSIALREAFPDLRLDAEVVQRTAHAYGITQHAARIREMLGEIAAPAAG